MGYAYARFSRLALYNNLFFSSLPAEHARIERALLSNMRASIDAEAQLQKLETQLSTWRTPKIIRLAEQDAERSDPGLWMRLVLGLLSGALLYGVAFFLSQYFRQRASKLVS